MIVISIQFLTLIGMPAAEADAIARELASDELAISYLFSFGGNGDRRSIDRAKASGATRLTLVGMSDRYGCAKDLGIEPREMCTAEFSARRPTFEEAIVIAMLLDSCADPMARRISALVRESRADDDRR